MIQGGTGGGNTRTGIEYEGRVDMLVKIAELPGYEIVGQNIYYEGKLVAKSLRKNALYVFLKEQGIDYKAFVSKKLLPDEAIYVLHNDTVHIIEMKFQIVAGSVDEKLQTCDFKKKQYQKLLSSLNLNVEYMYILSDWFQKAEYKDALDYIQSVGCRYYFELLPLGDIGLPVPG
jgi:hypothetical protein